MATPTALSSSMTQAIDLLETLNTLLIAERSALKERDTANIQSALNQKTDLLKQLELNATARSQLLARAGFNGDELGMENYLESLPVTAAPLKQQWLTLKEKLQTCKDANQVNGTIVHRSKTQVETLLNILRGQSGQQKIYNDMGKSSSVGGGHSLAKA
jgi:flagellar biosynthesis protein FlgN